jgi:hypothetical protein
MMTAAQYGNSAAYFQNNFNSSTSFMLGRSGGLAGKRPVSAYSVITVAGVNQSTQARIAASSGAVIGWLGLRPVAFPLTIGWNFNAPGT